MVILRPIEHHCAPLEGFRVGRVAQVAAAEVLGDDAHLHDRRIEQIAVQHDEAGVLAQRLLERPDHLWVLDLPSPAILSDRLSVHGARLLVDEAVLHQLVDYGRHAASVVIVLAQVGAGRLQVHQERHVKSVRLPVIECELHAEMAGYCCEVNRCVG